MRTSLSGVLPGSTICRESSPSFAAMFAGLTEMLARTVMGLFVIPVYGFTAACFNDQAAWLCSTTYIAIIFLTIVKKERIRLNPDSDMECVESEL